MLLYYITGSEHFAGDKTGRRQRLLDNVEEAARCGVNFVQLRERELTSSELEKLATEAVARIRKAGGTRLLINSRVDVAIASGADGVHLRSEFDFSASEARNIFHKAGVSSAMVFVSCHTREEVYLAEANGADLAVFGPVYGKTISASRNDSNKQELPGVGIAMLREVCHREAAASSRMPVLALGGVTLQNAPECLSNGAAGVAGIRLFQPASLSELADSVTALRKIAPQASKDTRKRHPYQT